MPWRDKSYHQSFLSENFDTLIFHFDFLFLNFDVAPPRIARGPAAYETAEVLLLQGAALKPQITNYK